MCSREDTILCKFGTASCCTETTTDISHSADELYTPVEEVENHTCTIPRKKRKVMEHMYNNASMPKEYQHVRCSIRKVRPEYFEVVDKLKSCFHMSQNQAEKLLLNPWPLVSWAWFILWANPWPLARCDTRVWPIL